MKSNNITAIKLDFFDSFNTSILGAHSTCIDSVLQGICFAASYCSSIGVATSVVACQALEMYATMFSCYHGVAIAKHCDVLVTVNNAWVCGAGCILLAC